MDSRANWTVGLQAERRWDDHGSAAQKILRDIHAKASEHDAILQAQAARQTL